MNISERLKCIKHINEKAHCVVRLNEDDTIKVVYDKAHKGKKPTLQECEEILPLIQAEMAIEAEKLEEERMIDNERELILETQAIESLKSKGKIFKHY